MNKKFFCVLVIVLAFGFISVSSAANLPGNLDDKLIDSIKSLANRIIAHNKHVFEQKLTGRELDYQEWDSNVTKHFRSAWDRVWAKNQTIVAATATDNKRNFELDHFITSDPNYIFAGGIHVGSRLSELERYLRTRLINRPSNYTDNHLSATGIFLERGCIHMNYYEFTGYDDDLYIMHSNGRITQIGYFTGGTYLLRTISSRSRTANFIRSQMRKMGMKNFPNMQ